MNSEDENGYEPGGVAAGLEPLGRYRRKAMSTTMQNIFDVLYEAEEPLTPETIAERTYERASGAARFHARRVVIRARVRRIASDRSDTTPRLEDDWTAWIKMRLRDARNRRVLIRDEQGRYTPNLDKPPTAARVDGSIYLYTREAWRATTLQERTVGEIHTMRMEADRLLGDLNHDELQLAIKLAMRDYWGSKSQPPNEQRRIRNKLRWLLERPTTDEAQSWLLHELLRRIYEESQGSSGAAD